MSKHVVNHIDQLGVILKTWNYSRVIYLGCTTKSVWFHMSSHNSSLHKHMPQCRDQWGLVWVRLNNSSVVSPMQFKQTVYKCMSFK